MLALVGTARDSQTASHHHQMPETPISFTSNGIAPILASASFQLSYLIQIIPQIPRSGKRATSALGFCGPSSSSPFRCPCSTWTSGTWTGRRCSALESKTSSSGFPKAGTRCTHSSTCGAATRLTITNLRQPVGWLPATPPRPTPTTVGARPMEVPRLTKRPCLQCPPWSPPQPTRARLTRASATSPSCSRCLTTRTTLLETLRPTTSPRKWSPAVTLHIRLLNLIKTYHQAVDLMISTCQASPPPYPGSEMLSQSPSQASSDFGVDPMEEDEGEYSCATNSDKLDHDV